MEYPSRYDVDRLFLRSLVAHDIADPLPSFDRATSAEWVRSVMSEERCPVAGVRGRGKVDGYVLQDELAGGACGDYAHPLDTAAILPDSADLVDVIKALRDCPWVFVKSFGDVGGIATRSDLQDPPVRMWLFGLITAMEMRFMSLIERRFGAVDDGAAGGEWAKYLSPARLEKAREMLDERRRRDQSPTLLDCLQFSDKGHIVARDSSLRERAGFPSRRRAEEVVKRLEKLRNDLAHAQDIIDSDLDTIVALAENLPKVMDLAYHAG
jgi:hypothetical protein